MFVLLSFFFWPLCSSLIYGCLIFLNSSLNHILNIDFAFSRIFKTYFFITWFKSYMGYKMSCPVVVGEYLNIITITITGGFYFTNNTKIKVLTNCFFSLVSLNLCVSSNVKFRQNSRSSDKIISKACNPHLLWISTNFTIIIFLYTCTCCLLLQCYCLRLLIKLWILNLKVGVEGYIFFFKC